ncbi:MAG TPA: DUF302 domain-containing protein [Terriglobales bacterium]|nr:DUF302 domain-containing protein [Terriglobales bacterium]
MENTRVIMGDREPTITYLMDADFDVAIKRIREALAAKQLSIAVEFNASRRLNRALGLRLSRCQILFIESPLLLLEAMAIDRCSAVFIPLHLVVSDAGKQTIVHLLNPEYLRTDDAPLGIRIPVKRLQGQLIDMLDEIAQQTHTASHLTEPDGAGASPWLEQTRKNQR